MSIGFAFVGPEVGHIVASFEKVEVGSNGREEEQMQSVRVE